MYEYKATVEHIVDGDTIDLNIDLGFDIIMRDQRVRLLGVDTPESRTRDLEEKKFGILATEFVEKFCPVGSSVTVRTEYDRKGKYGRILGTVLVDGVSLNEELINGHYAVAYEGQSKEDIEAAHLQNREILKESGIVS